MEIINQLIGTIAKFFEWWIIIMPWEQAIFIRAGKNPKVITNGLYFKIPFIDRIYIQPIRVRMIDLPVQTISTLDGKTITIKSVVGYSIKDILKMFNTISHPEMTIGGIVMGGISEYIRTTKLNDLSPKLVEEYLLNNLSKLDYGLGDISIKIPTWAEVKTFRLIQDASWLNENLNMKYIGEKN